MIGSLSVDNKTVTCEISGSLVSAMVPTPDNTITTGHRLTSRAFLFAFLSVDVIPCSVKNLCARAFFTTKHSTLVFNTRTILCWAFVRQRSGDNEMSLTSARHNYIFISPTSNQGQIEHHRIIFKSETSINSRLVATNHKITSTTPDS